MEQEENPVGVKSQVCSIHFIDKLIFNAFSVVHRFFVQFHWPGMLCTLIGLLACGMQVDLGWIASCPFAVAPQFPVNEGDDRRVGRECFPDDSWRGRSVHWLQRDVQSPIDRNRRKVDSRRQRQEGKRTGEKNCIEYVNVGLSELRGRRRGAVREGYDDWMTDRPTELI